MKNEAHQLKEDYLSCIDVSFGIHLMLCGDIKRGESCRWSNLYCSDKPTAAGKRRYFYGDSEYVWKYGRGGPYIRSDFRC